MKDNESYVRPLGTIIQPILQLLLDKFQLRTDPQGGKRIHIDFGNRQKTLFRDSGKQWLIENSDRKRVEDYQRIFDDFLLKGSKTDWEHANPNFPFRFCSGGVLPLIRMAGEDYACLFYRDIHPVGWNLASGGTNSIDELINPLLAAQRELREEIVVINPSQNLRYVFTADDDSSDVSRESKLARTLWDQHLHLDTSGHFHTTPIPLKWIAGPDTALITYEDSLQHPVTGFFLNINAEDFGIEFDRIAKFKIPEGSVICDGELRNGVLLNQPVGLFKINELLKSCRKGNISIYPDLLFYDGKSQLATVEGLDAVVRDYLSRRESKNIRKTKQKEAFDAASANGEHYNLCPNAWALIRRVSSEVNVSGKEAEESVVSLADSPEIFVSYAAEDYEYANMIYQELEKKLPGKVFFAPITTQTLDFSLEIDRALDTCRILLAVASNLRYLQKPWVSYEWRSFHNDRLSGEGNTSRTLIAVIPHNIDPKDLPRPLRQLEAIVIPPGNSKAAGDLLKASVLDLV